MGPRDDAERILAFHRECLRDTPPVAPTNLIRDSQTRLLLDLIFSGKERLRVLDYGCGNLRLLNALLSEKQDEEWLYCGADVLDPLSTPRPEFELLAAAPGRDRWRTTSLANLRTSAEAFDVVVLTNVLHELSVEEVAIALQDARRFLDSSGKLILMDTVLIPEGEPRFVPFYPWEIGALAPQAESCNYTSKSGVPIACYRVPRSSVPPYFGLRDRLATMLATKRDYWSALAVGLSRGEYPEARRALGLGEYREFDCAYLNAIVANASYRLLEHRLAAAEPPATAVDDAGYDLACLIEGNYGAGQEPPSAAEAIDKLGAVHDYAAIEAAILECAGWGVLMVRDATRPLWPTETWERLVDGRDWQQDVKVRGFRNAVMHLRRGDGDI